MDLIVNFFPNTATQVARCTN